MIRRRIMLGIENGGGADANCVSLYHFDSNLTDSMGNVPLSVKGSFSLFAGYSTTNKKFGSAAFLGVEVGEYGSIYNENSTLWKNAFANDYTIDFWVRWVDRTDYYDLDLCHNNYYVPWLSIRVMESELRVDSTPNSFNQAVTFSFSTSTWNHIAIVKKGTNLLAFINGVLKATWNFPYTIGSTHTYGSNISSWEMGYGLNSLDELRISNVARWTKNFIPPTTAYREIDVGGNGGNDENCITLLHFDNNVTNASAVSQTWTITSYTSYNSSIKKFGTHGICDAYRTGGYPMSLGVTESAGVLNPYLNGDWTAEAWLNIPTGSYYDPKFDSGIFFLGCKANSAKGYFALYISSSRIRLLHSTDGTNYDFDTEYTCTIPRTAWFHFAVVKKSGVITIYINGVAVVSNVSWNYSMNTLYKFADLNVYSYFYMDEFRFSNCARWTNNFTPSIFAYQ